jgi:hypothetical protein
MADCTSPYCTDYDPCPDCLAEGREAGLLPAAELEQQDAVEARQDRTPS